MQGIRNRYAHATEDLSSVDDQWRDLDTIQRFSNAIGTTQSLLDRVAQLKTGLLKTGYTASLSRHPLDSMGRKYECVTPKSELFRKLNFYIILPIRNLQLLCFLHFALLEYRRYIMGSVTNDYD